MTEELHFPTGFILLLAGLFMTLAICILIYHLYKTWRIKRLVSPRKEYTYRQKA